MWRKLYFHNARFEQGIERCANSPLMFTNPETGMIEMKSDVPMDVDANWLFFGHTVAKRDCYLWHHVMFKQFQLVPEFCRLRCYKVVVKVRNFLEAMQFYNAMLAAGTYGGHLTTIHGKVGIDERAYSDGYFNGFIYCDGLKDALEKYEAVKEIVEKAIPTGKDIPIIVKRTCTEFEAAFGPTDGEYWQEVSEDDLDLQHHIEDIVKFTQGSTVQPDWMKNKVITKMVRWANTVGDKSWLDFFECDDFLTMKAVTYHDAHKEVVEEKKKQAKAKAKQTKNKGDK